MSLSIIGQEKIDSIKRIARRCRCPGYAAEVGVYKGGVLLELAEVFPTRTVFGYDTFTGLPKEQWSEGELHHSGDFRGTSLAEVQQQCRGKNNIVLVPGMFPISAMEGMYAFVHLDVDFYLSTKQSLEWLMVRMSEGGAIVLDDWDWPYCPGVRKAVDELGLVVEVVPHMAHQAVIHF